MAPAHDAVLLISFGGPTRMEEVRPFLANVLRGRPIPAERVEEVVHHYELLGGRSPINDLTFRQADALHALLRDEGPDLPVYVGMRNWAPLLRDTLAEMYGRGIRRAVGLILSAQQSPAGWQRYQHDVTEAQKQLGADTPEVSFVDEWHSHPLLIECVTTRVNDALATLSATDRANAAVVFTAHSLPLAMADSSPYVSQLREQMEQVAKRCALARYHLAYQSRSGNPHEPWLGPDVLESLRMLAAENTRHVLLVPIGFVCDHVEVLYDLDIEAKAVAGSLGINLLRANTCNDHPLFIRMMADVVRKHVAAG